MNKALKTIGALVASACLNLGFLRLAELLDFAWAESPCGGDAAATPCIMCGVPEDYVPVR